MAEKSNPLKFRRTIKMNVGTQKNIQAIIKAFDTEIERQFAAGTMTQEKCNALMEAKTQAIIAVKGDN